MQNGLNGSRDLRSPQLTRAASPPTHCQHIITPPRNVYCEQKLILQAMFAIAGFLVVISARSEAHTLHKWVGAGAHHNQNMKREMHALRNALSSAHAQSQRNIISKCEVHGVMNWICDYFRIYLHVRVAFACKSFFR